MVPPIASSQEDIVEYVSLFFLSMTGLICFAVTGMGYWSLTALGVVKNASLTNALSYLTFSNIPVAMMQAVYYYPVTRQVPKYVFLFWLPCICAAFFGAEVLIRFDSLLFVRLCGVSMLLSLIVILAQRYLFDFTHQHSRHCSRVPQNDDGTADAYHYQIASAQNRIRDETDAGIDSDEEKEAESDSEDGYHYYDGGDDNLVTPGLYALDSWREYAEVCVAGATSGLFGGMFGIYGPPIKVFVLAKDTQRQVVNAITSVVVGFGAGVAYIVDFFIIHDEFRSQKWFTYVVVFAGAISGLCVGNLMAPYLDQSGFRVALYVILFCGGAQLLCVGMRTVMLWISLLLVILVAATTYYLVADALKRQRQRARSRRRYKEIMD